MNAPSGLSPARIAFFAAVVGIVAFDVFASQVLVGYIAPDLGLVGSRGNLVPTLAMLGYACGLLFVVPLADTVENRRLVMAMATACVASLLLAGLTHSASLFLLACFVSGASSSLIQVLVPLVGSLTPPAHRGRVLGNVMSGLLLGIMLSRPLASLIADRFGWRMVYLLSAFLIAAIALPVRALLPTRVASSTIGYRATVASMGTLLRREPVLRSNALTAALVMASFNVFWTSIVARLTSDTFHLSARGVAVFSLAATAGAVSAPIMGRFGDRGWTRTSSIFADVIVIGGLLLAMVAGGIKTLFVAAILMDFGVIGDQSLGRRAINMLDPAAIGRRNGLFTGIFFLGGALGSAIVGPVSAYAGWYGVCFTGAAFGFVALLVSIAFPRTVGATSESSPIDLRLADGSV